MLPQGKPSCEKSLNITIWSRQIIYDWAIFYIYLSLRQGKAVKPLISHGPCHVEAMAAPRLALDAAPLRWHARRFFAEQRAEGAATLDKSMGNLQPTYLGVSHKWMKIMGFSIINHHFKWECIPKLMVYKFISWKIPFLKGMITGGSTIFGSQHMDSKGCVWSIGIKPTRFGVFFFFFFCKGGNWW